MFYFSPFGTCYTDDMKPLLGFFWLCVLFAACFSTVHITLSILQPAKRKPADKEMATAETPPEKKESTKTEKQPEPVYYIVEKTKRKKQSYSKPKRIKFE